MSMSTIRIERDGGITRLWLARRQARNALNGELIEELTRAFIELAPDTRAVVLGGDGAAFCAGADLGWMRAGIDRTEGENRQEARVLSAMFQAVDLAPCVVIARVQGAALGGGAGLAACSDIVVADEGARFGFTEVRLGLVPAVISPFVLRRIGAAKARRHFLTGEPFGALEAQRLGLVDELASSENLDGIIAGLTDAVLRSAPGAVTAAKRLVRVIEGSDEATAHDHAADTIAALRVQPEAQEGMRAFLEKRPPRWS
jgi:methylglutaconyl-CoA hydratase